MPVLVQITDFGEAEFKNQFQTLVNNAQYHAASSEDLDNYLKIK